MTSSNFVLFFTVALVTFEIGSVNASAQSVSLHFVALNWVQVHLDLLDPAPQGHGITTLADKVARMPLLRPLFR